LDLRPPARAIALQLLKLMVDAGQVQAELSRHGLDWSGQLAEILDVHLGEGMGAVWRAGQKFGQLKRENG
jgi:hypothetical protein